MNIYTSNLNLPIPSPLQLLYDVMTMNVSCWTPRDIKDCADLADYTGLNFKPGTFGFRGVTGATRTNLGVGDDLSITWSRSKTTLADGSVFDSFYAGRYMSSYYQWGAYQPTATNPVFTYDDESTSGNYGAGLAEKCGNKSRHRSLVFGQHICGQSQLRWSTWLRACGAS